MKLLRVSEGYDFSLRKTIRYFSIPRSYDRLYKILTHYQSRGIIINPHGDRHLNYESYIYSLSDLELGSTKSYLFQELLEFPLKDLLLQGLQIESKGGTHYHSKTSNYSLWLEIIDTDDRINELQRYLGEDLHNVPYTGVDYSLVLQAYKAGDRDLPILSLDKYTGKFVPYLTSPEHFASNNNRDVVEKGYRYFFPILKDLIGFYYNFPVDLDSEGLPSNYNYRSYIESKFISCLKFKNTIEIRVVETFYLENPSHFKKPIRPVVFYIDTEETYRFNRQYEYEHELELLKGYRKAL